MDITHTKISDETDSSDDRIIVATWGDLTIEVPEADLVAIHDESHGVLEIPGSMHRILWNGEKALCRTEEVTYGWEAFEKDVGIEADYAFNVDEYEYVSADEIR